jgi:hypothetical protein
VSVDIVQIGIEPTGGKYSTGEGENTAQGRGKYSTGEGENTAQGRGKILYSGGENTVQYRGGRIEKKIW